MKDNGLLKYFFEQREKNNDGYLDLDKIKTDKSQVLSSVLGENSYKIIENKGFYIKDSFLDYIEAEVLLSQIYSQAGIPSAIYLPCKHLDNLDIFDKLQISKDLNLQKVCNGVISNDVEKQNSFDGVLLENVVSKKSDNKYSTFFFPEKKDDFMKISNIFTKEGAREYIKMCLFDAASFNTDRNEGNVFYNLNRDSKVESITTIDHEVSGLCSSFNSKYLDTHIYINNLGNTEDKTLSETVEQLKKNETINEYITPNELAESLGNVDVKKVADDIEQTTGFEISRPYIETLQKSYDTVAEQLLK